MSTTLRRKPGKRGHAASEASTVEPRDADGADDTKALPAVAAAENGWFRPSAGGWFARAAAWVLLLWLILAVPANVLSPFDFGVSDINLAIAAVIFAIIGLSLNVLIGYAGQLSLGHQAFVGIGAFASAYVVTNLGLGFWFGVVVAAGFGAVQALALGAVSLRVTGLYFALVSLAYGTFAENSLFAVSEITGGEGGKPADRPAGFAEDQMYYFLCLAFLVLVLWLDWRLTRSKGGRALQALRENPRVAASYGIDVRRYTLLAFVVSGTFAGIGGALMAHHQQIIVPGIFDFQLALIFVVMTVVGGLRNRIGVVIGSAFFAGLGEGGGSEGGGFLERTIGLPAEFTGIVIGPFLLLIVITLLPGGIGQLIGPVKDWMLGKRFDRNAGKLKEVEVSDVRA
ncbi:branched-chain amino acid ABC transporter permease [Haloechinothrix sp. YIM 98757]|uniref:Branched-chain amino acid ABC transporter permease n=1 Tax=Haloechinothrix aidingensis TaxID=2752311 RepID=A0A838A9A6_9PSEU|nr:branched-chain amino acid ABC transporter permease [Haloechinothrix aidingensis]MBA0126088.1 branched-chain amino acid ABC transporter permease [Haloechinothrix aidingensis]